jgi:hypothetical protein
MMLELHRSNIDQLFHMYVLSTTVQASFEVHTTSYSMGTRGNFPWEKRQEREVDHSISIQIRDQELLALFLHSAICLHVVYRENYVNGLCEELS